MNRSVQITAAALVGSLAVLVLSARPAMAIMAGTTPDSPANRVDPNTAQSPYAGVGSIVVGGSPLSGVVVAAQYVLTAAHVVSGHPPSDIRFVLNRGGTPWISAVESVTVYPTFSFPYDDLAVIRLAGPVPADVPIYKLYTGTIRTGLTMTLVGYGASGNGDTGVSVGASSTVKRVGGNAVDQLTVALDNSGRTSRFYVYDFDGPTGTGSMGGATLGNATETVVAVGDSGSPSFVHNGTALQLFGINNFVGSPSGGTVNYAFSTVGGGIVVCDPVFASWLQTATNGTLGIAQSTDVPLPMWSIVLLLAAISMAWMRLNTRRPV